MIRFSTPVRGSAVQRKVRLIPETPFTVRDTTEESAIWHLPATLKPRQTYAVATDTGFTDIFGQRLTGSSAIAVKTTGYSPSVEYPFGRLVVERKAFRTLAVQHVNVDTLVVSVAPVPDSLEGSFLRRSPWSLYDLWSKVARGRRVIRIPVSGTPDVPKVTGVKLPVTDAARPTLYAVTITAPNVSTRDHGGPPISLVQVTDIGVHAKLGVEGGAVWVTSANDGTALAGADVTVFDAKGRRVTAGRTDARGLVTFAGLRVTSARDTSDDDDDDWQSQNFEGYVAVQRGTDRALVGVSQYDPDLSPWRFNVSSAWGDDRRQAAGAVFTERGIYRPGEPLYAKAIVRHGPLGALRAPARGDSLRWQFKDREDATLKDTIVALSEFGTASYEFQVPRGAQLGHYGITVQAKWQGTWQNVGYTSYRVAEYRPPEFLVDLTAPEDPRFPGDTLRATVQARYLFGAPMGRAALTWQARQVAISSWELEIPNTEGFFVGESGWWWEEDGYRAPDVQVFASGTDTLDASGRRELRVALPTPTKGRAARVTLSTAVSDVNRQVVGSSAAAIVHPASFYIGAKPLGDEYFWRAGREQQIAVIAVRPDGRRVSGVAIKGTITRREWHQVHRERGGIAETVGEWVTDTVARCSLTTTAEPANCAVTPKAGGTYVVTLTATDPAGRTASTSFYRWAAGSDWVPWNDETRFKMDVIPDRTRYSVGDTATVLFASPFTDAEAWITVEREGLLEQRRQKLSSGSTTLKLPITEAHAPNAFVSIFVVRGRSAPPGRFDDPGRPTIRVGYAELRVTPEVKRLKVNVEPLEKEYRPGDTARVRLAVLDGRGAGQRSEVTLWAVDEGVLALTGYKTPDPLDLLYRPRGLGMRLASNLVSVAPQIPEGEKGKRAPGGGGGADLSEILRSRFKTTAFFLGSVVTDAQGRATAVAKLPDNLTTFRVMAVAVTAGDRFGSGESPMLVTRPLIARPALPRFVRAGDEVTAGTVVNQRAGGTPTVRVEAIANGVELRGDKVQTARLETGRGREIRFPFRVSERLGDSATFRFNVTGAGDADAVQLKIPVKPDYHPRAYTVSGTLVDSSTVELTLPAGIDPARSRLSMSLGMSPLAVIRGAYERLRVYPYYCTEQLMSIARPLIALYRAQQATGQKLLKGDPKRDIEEAVDLIAARQRTDGGIGYWSGTDWSTPWLSGYAGIVLLDARQAGIVVSDTVLARLAAYLERELKNQTQILTPVAHWYENRQTRLSDQVAAVDFLSRFGRPDVASENQLIAVVPQMAWEDRVRLAEVVARRGARTAARQLLAAAWNTVKVEGRRAVLPDSIARQNFYFMSTSRPAARLLTATLAVDSAHVLIGPLVETLLQQHRSQPAWYRNTQDDASMVNALEQLERRQRESAGRTVRVRAGRRVLLEARTAAGQVRDSVMSLSGLLSGNGDSPSALRLSLDTERPAGSSSGGALYYFVTVHEVPLRRPVTPDEQGIQVERWYERVDRPTPIVSAEEGQLVRVRLRITVPSERQFVVLDDALPGGLEAIDVSLRTASSLPGPGTVMPDTGGRAEREDPDAEGAEQEENSHWYYGSWDSGWWSPFDHKEIRDDRVVYFATVLWKGTYTATYIARATTPGVFVRPPAHAEEMYNPAVHGRSDGGVFTVTAKKGR
ncbi:MAG TPA: MG2 domain-containing protein [Gemmatimonadaceae bacterium]|nr:MG2 domain-containing protein [Gemmatimonadaceae bacterium]